MFFSKRFIALLIIILPVITLECLNNTDEKVDYTIEELNIIPQYSLGSSA